MALRTGTAALGAALALLATGCSSNDGTSADGSPSSTSTTAAPGFTVAPAPTLDPAAALTKPFTSKVFKPAFSLRLPAEWVAVERDVGAFQAYLGDEDFEITFDHDLRQRESVDQGVERLRGTPGATPGPAEEIVVGGRRGKALTLGAEGRLEFAPSGFHVPSGPIVAMVLPVPDGTTITVFLTSRTDKAAVLPALRALADRVLATVRWS